MAVVEVLARPAEGASPLHDLESREVEAEGRQLFLLTRDEVLVSIAAWFTSFLEPAVRARRPELAGAYYQPTIVDILTFLGSFGLFFTLVLLFIRFLPMVAMAEVKTVMPIADAHSGERRSVGDYHGDIPRHVRNPEGGQS